VTNDTSTVEGKPETGLTLSRSERFEQARQSVEPFLPHYDVRQASRVYAGTAGTLAGFAFTVIVILMTRQTDCAPGSPDPLCGGLDVLRGRAVAALFVAFSA
jgi:hypothetical protein